MSGRLLPEVEPKIAPAEELRGLPLIVVHGTADEVLQISYGRAIRTGSQLFRLIWSITNIRWDIMFRRRVSTTSQDG